MIWARIVFSLLAISVYKGKETTNQVTETLRHTLHIYAPMHVRAHTYTHSVPQLGLHDHVLEISHFQQNKSHPTFQRANCKLKSSAERTVLLNDAPDWRGQRQENPWASWSEGLSQGQPHTQCYVAPLSSASTMPASPCRTIQNHTSQPSILRALPKNGTQWLPTPRTGCLQNIRALFCPCLKYQDLGSQIEY